MGVGRDGAGSTKVMEKDPEGSGQNTSLRHLTLSSMRGVRIVSGWVANPDPSYPRQVSCFQSPL